jgi:hypothetical protein
LLVCEIAHSSEVEAPQVQIDDGTAQKSSARVAAVLEESVVVMTD